MKPLNAEKTAKLSAITLLAVAIALFAAVVERLVAAIWQWYKFSGYSNDGHITLSFNTAIHFSLAVAATFFLSLVVNRISALRSLSGPRALSLWAIYVSAASAATYWILGLSSLNAWRA